MTAALTFFHHSAADGDWSPLVPPPPAEVAAAAAARSREADLAAAAQAIRATPVGAGLAGWRASVALDELDRGNLASAAACARGAADEARRTGMKGEAVRLDTAAGLIERHAPPVAKGITL